MLLEKNKPLSCLCLARNSRFFTTFKMMFWTKSSTPVSCSLGGEASLNVMSLCCTSLDGRGASVNATSFCCTSLDRRGASVNATSFCCTSLDGRGPLSKQHHCSVPHQRGGHHQSIHHWLVKPQSKQHHCAVPCQMGVGPQGFLLGWTQLK